MADRNGRLEPSTAMEPLSPRKGDDAYHDAPNSLATSPAPTETPLRSKRRRKPSARYLGYIKNPDLIMSDCNPPSDDDSVPRPTSLLVSSTTSHDIDHEVSDQPSEMETTALSSPYDADEEDEGNPGIGKRLRKRSTRSVPRLPSKQNRQLRGKRVFRKTPSNLGGEASHSPHRKHLSPSNSNIPPLTARKRSRSGRDVDSDEALGVYHTEPDLPGIKLWDQRNRILVPGKVLPSQLGDILRKNENYAVYVGQDGKYMKYPGELLDFATPAHQERWMSELRKDPAKRRVMIFDPRKAKLLSPPACPTLDDLTCFLDKMEHERSGSMRRRLFNAHYTDSHGFTRERWHAVFSIPVPPSNKLASNAAPQPREALRTLQPPSQLPPPSSRPSRQLKHVRYREASSDSREFQAPQTDYPDEQTSQTSNERLSPKRHRSSVRFVSPPTPISHDFDALNQIEHDADQGTVQRTIYQEMFPTSSSEFERADVPVLSSPNASSDECDYAKNGDPPNRSVSRNNISMKTVSPASVLVLNRTPILRLERMYKFDESSASEASLCDPLGEKGFHDVQSPDNETTQPPQEILRLQLTNHAAKDAQTDVDSYQSAQPKETAPLSHRLHVDKPSTYANSHQKNAAPVKSSMVDAKRVPISENEARGYAAVWNSVLMLETRLRNTSPSASPSLEVAAPEELLDASGKEISNNAQSNSPKRGCSAEKPIGTNENLVCTSATKKDKGAEDELPESSHLCERGVSAPAQLIETRQNNEATPCQSSCTKERACSAVVKSGKRAKAAHLQPNQDCVSYDANESRAGELRVPKAGSRIAKSRPRHPLAQCSEEVYLWDYATKRRSDTPILLSAALSLCSEDDKTMIYDGQDIRTGDRQYPEIWNDTQAWISRRGTRPTSKRKVRVWEHCTGKLEKFSFSPPVLELENWLKDNPDKTLFRPSLLMQYERRPSIREARRTDGTLESRVKQAIHDQVLRRIKDLRVTDLSDGPQQQVIFWNILKRKCEPPRDFASRSHLTRFLFSNPALELLRGQDDVSQLERSTELKLIHVTGNCPANLINFWDTRLKACLRLIERKAVMNKTVLECITADPCLDVYIGQDRPEVESVKKMITAAKETLTLSSRYTLACCGRLVQEHVYSQGWVPKYIDTRKESATHATFWCKSRTALTMEPLNGQLLSIEEYLKTSADLELYVGQDMPVEVQKQLHTWFQVLRYEPGHGATEVTPMLLRFSLVPLKYRAIRFASREEVRVRRKQLKRQRRRHTEPPERGLKGSHANRGNRTKVKRQRLSLRVSKRSEDGRDHRVNISRFTAEEESAEGNDISVPPEVTSAQSQDTTRYEEENLDGSEGPGSALTPSSSTLDAYYSETNSECDTAVGTEGDASLPFPNGLQEVEDHVRSATKSAKKMVCVIRDAGPKVLKRELIYDVRQTLREQLILEVESVSHLMALVKQFNSHDFASLANELCEELQLLDVHGCFSCSADLGYTPNDLSSIREELETGQVCTSYGIIKKFREVCAGLIHFHDGTLLHGQAALLKSYGEELIARFQKSHAVVIEKEQQMLRVFRICDRAKHIGFRTVPGSRKSKQTSTSLSLGSSELSLRVSRRQPEVTFLNYRDEKGNSVMGKRPSVRVFGFTIDTKALERSIGNIRPCHICRRDVILSQADSMTCTNRVFHICEEVVCRECLETVFSLEQNEFKILRDSENWFCIHCRGLCPSGSECTGATTESRNAKCRVKFVWPHARGTATSVIAVLAKRHRNGEYVPFRDTLPSDKFDLTKDASGKNWFSDMYLHIGAYRCQVMVNNVWGAGTTFHVLPHQEGSVPACQLGKPYAIPSASVLYLRGPHPSGNDIPPKLTARTRPRGPRIRWHHIPKGPAYPVHAIRNGSPEDGGTMVKDCSRTEGYDWRRAKRHATLQWVPELRTADESDESQQQDCKTLALCATDSERAHLVATDSPPIPSVGVSHQDFLVALNTFRYKEMLKSLWSIVTGRSSIHGIGLFTLSGYKKGDFVIEYAGDLIRTPLADIREARYDAAGLGTYLFKINDEQIVDATVQSNRARFTNHSCDPNMVADIVHVQGRDLIALRATREIPKFTELTFDYKFPYEEAKVQCLCNSWNCVGVMN